MMSTDNLHSVEWARNWSRMTNDRAARRAQEEYDKAAVAFRQGNRSAAAFYLGAMAHYVGDVSQYGHAIPGETHHGDYESRSRLATWVFPFQLPDGRLLGDLPVNQVTREMIGAVIWRVKESGRSLAIIEGIRNPLRGYYAAMIETKMLAGPNPAADLKFFIGKQTQKRARQRKLSYFAQEEGPQLFATARALFPRWHAFIATGVLAGLRWGESAALYKTDIDWKRGRIHVQRTFSEKGNSIERCKDGDDRWVKASPALVAALRSHIDAVDLEAQVKGWTPEQRQLVFPNTVGRIIHHGQFVESVWQPLLAKAGLAYRKYHSTRHTYATWMLEDGADLRWVQAQMGHASIEETAGTYGHCQPERHEGTVAGLDRYLTV
jgi:integrase